MTHYKKDEKIYSQKTTLALEVGGFLGSRETADLERLFQELMVAKLAVEVELDARKKEFVSRKDYLKSLNSNYAVYQQEAPRIRSELGALKKKIEALAFETEGWAQTMNKQEQQLETLEETSRQLSSALAKEDNLKALEKSITIDQKDLAVFGESKERFLEVLAEHGKAHEGSSGSEALGDDFSGDDVGGLIAAIEDLIVAIKECQRQTEDAMSQQDVLTAGFGPLEKSIATVAERLADRRQKLNRLQGEVAELTEKNVQASFAINSREEEYRAYEKTIKESAEIKERYASLVEQVNDACAELKGALVENSKLGLALRLESLKINLLVTEFENIA